MKNLTIKFISLIPLSLILLLAGCSENIAVLNPQGPVAQKQYDLIMYSVWFMLAIVLVVFILFIVIVIRYREKPDNMDYEPPHQEGSHLLEFIWTAIPVAIIIALSIPTVKVTFDLEKPPSDKEPIVVHVTSANWKWIFSYPEQDIETVNYLVVPEDTPIQFKMTSASTMNSFWVPELGGMEYNMAGHATEMYLQADRVGTYSGRSANFSGRDFAHMTFDLKAVTDEDFNKWVSEVKSTSPSLTEDKYNEILKPGLVGTMTFSNTHLHWIDHSKQGTILDVPQVQHKH